MQLTSGGWARASRAHFIKRRLQPPHAMARLPPPGPPEGPGDSGDVADALMLFLGARPRLCSGRRSRSSAMAARRTLARRECPVIIRALCNRWAGEIEEHR